MFLAVGYIALMLIFSFALGGAGHGTDAGIQLLPVIASALPVAVYQSITRYKAKLIAGATSILMFIACDIYACRVLQIVSRDYYFQQTWKQAGPLLALYFAMLALPQIIFFVRAYYDLRRPRTRLRSAPDSS